MLEYQSIDLFSLAKTRYIHDRFFLLMKPIHAITVIAPVNTTFYRPFSLFLSLSFLINILRFYSTSKKNLAK